MVGQRINKYLNDRGIKQSFLVEKTGISQMAICNICKEKRKVDVVEYDKICKALGVSLETFLRNEEA